MHGHRAENVDLVAYHDLDASPGFKLGLQVVDGRWYLHVSRFWQPGSWVLDVTDPASPAIVGEIEGPPDPNVATWQLQVADGLLIQGLEHRPAPWGGDPDAATAEGIRIWEVTDPLRPSLLGAYEFGHHGTHRNHYTGGQYVHATASVRGFDGNIYSILDIGDPRDPVEVGRWFLPEQFVAGGARPSRRLSLHGPAWPVGDLAYLPYGGAGLIVLDISDPGCPTLVGRLDLGAAFSNHIAMHTVVPLPGRQLAVINTEAIAERVEEPYNLAGIVDIADPSAPRLLSLLPPPTAPADAPYERFHTRGGRFGPHNQHHHQESPHLFRSEHLLYLTWFNAGLRVYDITDAYVPREVGWFLPDDPTERRGLLPRTALVTQSEDVLVDARGYAYVTDKNHGLHVVRFTGEVPEAAGH